LKSNKNHLSEQQAEELNKIYAKEGKTAAELVRTDNEQMLHSNGVFSHKELRRRALGVVGKFNDKEDMAANHDRLASDAYE
jgi:hypothetical protein